MKIFLDDERHTPSGWTRTYTVEETIAALETKQIQELSLDNDLGEGLKEGHTVLAWLEEKAHFDKTFPIPIITIHSANAGRVPSMKQTVAKLELLRKQQHEH